MNSVGHIYESLAAELARLSGREGVLDLVEERKQAEIRRLQAAEGAMDASSVPAVGSVEPVPAARRGPDRKLAVALAGVALLLVAGMIWLKQVRPRDRAPSAITSADLLAGLPAPSAGVRAPPATAELAEPPLTIFSDAPDDAAAARVSADLAKWIAPGLGQRIETVRSAGWADALAQSRSPGHVAIVGYDALQAQRATRDAAGALRIVSPLHLEDVQFLVRADSPLHFIHEIEGRRINAGDPRFSRALTAGSIYRRMFGRAPASWQLDAQDEAAGLADLIAGRIDVLVRVGAAQPGSAGDSSPSAGSRLRLLALDATNPAARKALQQFLPSRTPAIGASVARAAQDAVPTLAVMSFLVTSEPDGPASRERLGRLVHALCEQKGALARRGERSWRSVEPSLQPVVGWPYDEAAARELGMCSNPRPPTPRSSR